MIGSKETIAIASNTVIPAYFAIKNLGFDVSNEEIEGEKTEYWIAENKSIKFIATGPIELLGLIAMYQQRGPNWRPSDEEIEDYFSKFD